MAADRLKLVGSLWVTGYSEPLRVALAQPAFRNRRRVYGWWEFVVGWVAFGWHWGPFFVFECVFVLGVFGGGCGRLASWRTVGSPPLFSPF